MLKPMKVRLLALLFLGFGIFVSQHTVAQVQTARYVPMITNSNAYYEYLPQGYNPAGSETYPLLLFIHGLGELGVGDSWTLPMVLRNGPPRWINYGGWPQSFTVNGQTHKFIVISPQFVAWPSSWDIDNIITYCIQNYKVNPNRIYMTGLSMGGGVTWNYASENSTFANRLAGIVPICGASWPDMTRSRIMAGANLPVWATHNDGDGIAPLFYTVDYVNQINLAPSPTPLAKKTIFVSTSHDAWSTTYNPSWRENGLNIYEWMLQYQRGNPPVPNQLPIARAGANITLALPANSTTLNGNTSSDPDGSITGYSWRKISGPAQITLGNTTYFYCSLSNLTAGTYAMELTVTDNSAGIGKDTVLVTVTGTPGVNQPPVARAGTDINVYLPGNWGQLNGNTSTDADGTISSYAWTKISGPTQFTINNAAIVNPIVSNLVAGTYVFRLTVTDNSGATAYDDININVIGAANQLPTANAGANITLTLPTNSAQLNGSGTDPDGTIATYSWSKISGPASYAFSNGGIYNPTINNLSAGTYVLRLTVVDNSGGVATDDISIIVNAQTTNQAPLSKAGTDINAFLPGNWAQLNGSGSSDPDGTISTYSWTKTSGPAQFTINNAGIVNPMLTNLVAGTYVFRLTVTDNAGATAYDDMNVNVIGAANQLPTANAGPNITMTLPTSSAQVNGSGSDPDGSITTYRWSKVSGPSIFTISNTAISNPLISNLAVGTYVFRLTVTDNSGGTATDDINIIVNAQTANQVPRANAGTDITSWLPGNWAQLNGNGSSDPDGTITGYSWSRVGGPTQFTINNAAIVNPILTNLVAGTYVFRLTVTDNSGATAYDEINVNVIGTTTNVLPTANAGMDVNMTLPTSSTQVNGSGSDPDGTIASYKWSRISGPAIFTISNTAIANPLISNLAVGAYVFRLTVTDNSGGTATDDINIIVNAQTANQVPRANAGVDITSWLPGNWAQLNGNGSYDPDGTIAGYSWVKVAGPTQFTINNPAIVNPIISNLVAGTYVIRLTVTDNSGATAYDEINVYVNGQTSNQVPVVNAGANINIFMPGNWARLNGTASDGDGTISSYRWTRVSGPTQFTISNATVINPLLTNLVVGTYVFRLTVTDNAGATASDDMTIFAYSTTGQLSTANPVTDNTPSEEVSRVVNENRTTSLFKLYPNPVRDNVLVELSDTEQGPLQVVLTDILGKTIRSWSFQKTNIQWRQSLNISNIAQGTYVLTVKGKTIKKTQQFIKE